jgi:hypothetical protein
MEICWTEAPEKFAGQGQKVSPCRSMKELREGGSRPEEVEDQKLSSRRKPSVDFPEQDLLLGQVSHRAGANYNIKGGGK